MTGRILYIEDEQLNITVLEKMLKLMDFELITAMTGTTGVYLAHHARPDLILMDINLPDISGLDATQQIKNHPELAHIPIVALTSDTSNYRACREAGCDGYLNKPVNRTNLLRTIHQFTHDTEFDEAS